MVELFSGAVGIEPGDAAPGGDDLEGRFATVAEARARAAEIGDDHFAICEGGVVVSVGEGRYEDDGAGGTTRTLTWREGRGARVAPGADAAPRHRGPHPSDRAIFAPARLPALREAVADLSWLFGRGYGEVAAIAVVGDRYQLRKRARLAAARMAAPDAVAAARRARRLDLDALRGRPLVIDGFNVLVTGESALSGAVVLRGRDGALRDLGSVYGSYRAVDETERVIATLVEVLGAAAPASVTWLLDRPVSNSGRLAARLRAAAPGWTVELVDAPDPALAASTAVVATADAWILDRCAAWIDLPAAVIAARGATPWLIEA